MEHSRDLVELVKMMRDASIMTSSDVIMPEHERPTRFALSMLLWFFQIRLHAINVQCKVGSTETSCDGKVVVRKKSGRGVDTGRCCVFLIHAQGYHCFHRRRWHSFVTTRIMTSWSLATQPTEYFRSVMVVPSRIGDRWYNTMACNLWIIRRK